MTDNFSAALRLFRPDADRSHDPHALACRELLRPVRAEPNRRALEPFSRSWFEELEQKRYARNGSWLPRVLEFSRHTGESLLMLRPGLGSDAVQYHRHGVDVTIGTMPGDAPELVSKNIALRGLSMPVVPVDGPALPFASDSFDLVSVNALHLSPPGVEEIFRVLRPGGKVFGLYPARFGLGFWCRIIFPLQTWTRGPDDLATSAGSLRNAYRAFEKHRFSKRHLRRADLPAAWKVIPHGVAERLIGEVLAVRAFKPLRAARPALARAA